MVGFHARIHTGSISIHAKKLSHIPANDTDMRRAGPRLRRIRRQMRHVPTKNVLPPIASLVPALHDTITGIISKSLHKIRVRAANCKY